MGLKKYLFIILMGFLAAGFGFAYDFGLVVDQEIEQDMKQKEAWKIGNFKYSLSAVPWFSTPIGEKANFYASLSFTEKYEYEEWIPIFELTRTELVLRLQNGLTAEIGRIGFSDPLGIIVSGLFDGVKGFMGIKGNRLSFGAFYTGLQYKKTAEIAMTTGDLGDYSNNDIYFASRRILGFFRWEMPVVFNVPVSFLADGFFQFDVNHRDNIINSQYLTLQALYSPVNALNLNLGAVLGVAEITGRNAFANFAADAGVTWMLPTPLKDFASLKIRWSSGAVTNNVGPFTPVTTIPQGKVFTPKLSGLMTTGAEYTFSLIKDLSVSADASLLFRTDLKTQDDPDMDRQSDSFLLGGEITAAVRWAPVSDVQLAFEGGAFFPGTAMIKDTPVRGLISLELILSF
jgi:hypothetical protein